MRTMKDYHCKRIVKTVDCMGACYRTIEYTIKAETKKQARETFKRWTGVLPKTVEEIA